MSASARVVRLLGAVGARWPLLSLVLSDVVSTVVTPFRRHSWRELRVLFPAMTTSAARRSLRRALRLNFRDQVVADIAWRRHEKLREVIRVEELVDRLHGPAIIATFHIGPLQAFRLVANDTAYDSLFVRAYGRELDGAAAFHRGVATLRRGGIVAVPVDPRHGSRTSARFFGREVQFARGAFALARLTGAPVVPVIFVWRGYRARPVVGDPLQPPPQDPAADPPAWESILANSVATWLERYLTEHPLDTGLRAIKLFSVSR